MPLTISRAFTKAQLEAHSLLGIVFGAAIYLLCFSGTLAVLADRLERWERPDVPAVAAASPELLARVAREGYALARREGPVDYLYVGAPSDLEPGLSVSGNGRSWDADGAGALSPSPETPWTAFMRGQHHDFNLPDPWGGYLVGLLGTLLIAGLVSGLLAHRQIVREAFHLRRGGTPRRGSVDLHNRMGVWPMPFHFIVALTGSLLGLAGLIIGVLAFVAFQGDQDKAIAALTGPAPVQDLRPAPLPDVAPMIRAVAARAPGAPVTSIVVEQAGTAGQIVSLTTAEPSHLSRNEAWTFAADGRFLAKAGFTDGSLGMRIYGMIQPLHYGTYGGFALQLVYVLLGASMTITVATGISIWLARRREQGRAAPRRELLWRGLLWGQPLAFALSAAGALVLGAPPMPVYWAIVAAALAGALLLPARTAGLWPKAAAVALLIAAGAHAATRPGLDRSTWWVDTALLLIAIGLAFPRGARRERADTAGAAA